MHVFDRLSNRQLDNGTAMDDEQNPSAENLGSNTELGVMPAKPDYNTPSNDNEA
jgi:hypothetical protein